MGSRVRADIAVGCRYRTYRRPVDTVVAGAVEVLNPTRREVHVNDETAHRLAELHGPARDALRTRALPECPPLRDMESRKAVARSCGRRQALQRSCPW